MKAKLYVNKEILKYNMDYIKDKIGERKNIIAMVKANAYGVGDTLIANELQNMGIKNFGVACIDEAIRLRNNNITGMILVTSVLVDKEIESAIEEDISISVSNIQNIKDINEIAKQKNKIAKIHIKIDTGMTRLGFSKDNIIINFTNILKYKNIKIEGIYTHLSCADSDKEYTNNQINEFKYIVENLSKNYEFKYIHILNSDGVEYYSDKVDFDTHVRVGIIMYGYCGDTKPVLKLTAPVINVTNVDKYTKVGYGGTVIVKPNTKVAVIKIGYADGISRSLSNNINVIINGIKCRQIGNICMDMMMADVTDVKDIKVNDEAIIWDYENDLKEIAKLSNKITYEVISNLGSRIERVIK